MAPGHYGMTIVAATSRKKLSRDWQVVLAAAGIASTVHHDAGRWHLSVNEADADQASHELSDYLHENEIDSANQGLDDLQGDEANEGHRATPAQAYPGAFVGVMLFLLTIVFCQVVSSNGIGQVDWFQIGCMNAGAVRSGQWWRVTTALLLHRDSLHLISNALFGTLFGFLASRNIGGGAAWFGIVLSGTLGNLINAYTRSAEHTSVGVSTAVFGALGLLIAQAIRPKATAMSAWHRWSPMIGGLILFLYLGIGDENTDTAAHFYGLLSGLLIGAAMRSIPSRFYQKVDTQFWFGVNAIATIIAAWSLAIATS